MPSMKNIRTMTMSSSSSGKDVKSTSQLKGEASKTAAEKETNVTTQYETGANPKGGPLGGEPSGL